MTSTPAAPALSAEQLLKELRYTCDDGEGGSTFYHEHDAALAMVRTAIAAPAPAVVGEALAVPAGVYESAVTGRREFRTALREARERIKALETELDLWKTIATNEYGENEINREWIESHVCDAAPRPSRDDAGQAVAWQYRIFRLGEWRAWTDTDDHEAVRLQERGQLDGYPAEVRPLYAHPPAPSAEAGRFGELEAAAREFLVATEALGDWINGNDLVADWADAAPEDYQRMNGAMRRIRAALTGGAS